MYEDWNILEQYPIHHRHRRDHHPSSSFTSNSDNDSDNISIAIVTDSFDSSSLSSQASLVHVQGSGVAVTASGANDDSSMIASAGYTGRIVVLLLLITVLTTNNDKYQNNSQQNRARSSLYSNQSANLGAAAIGSLTDFLSPVLPFAGGRDLLREYGEARDAVASSTYQYLTKNGSSLISIASTAFSLIYTRDSSSKSATTNTLFNTRGGASISSEADLTSEAKARRIAVLNGKVPSPILGANDPFMSINDIAGLTLHDISDIFNYAINRNRQGFDAEVFRSNLSARVNAVIDKMEEAVDESRGADVNPVFTASRENNEIDSSLSSTGFGDVDVLRFCGAMRIFAEWRLLRQVPENYKAYAVGMSLGHKDVVQNIAKIERAYFAWIEERRFQIGQGNDYQLVGPTIRDLLQVEVDLDVHENKLPRLKEKSAAMGLLWVRRQLMYQTRIFSNINSGDYSDAVTAVAAAYSQVYNDYHSWTVQKIFNYSFKAAPPAEEIFKFMNPLILKEVTEKAKSISFSSVKDTMDSNFSVSDDLYDNTNDHQAASFTSKRERSITNDFETENVSHEANRFRPLEDSGDHDVAALALYENEASSHEHLLQRLGNHIAHEWDKLTSHWVMEWGKVSSNIVSLFIRKSHHITQTLLEETTNNNDSSERGLTEQELEEHVTLEMTRVAQKQIASYLSVISPLLDDLKGLFEEMNMDDPTKV